MKKFKVGLIGFGLSGKVFHAPLMKAHGGYEIELVSTSRADEVRALLPQAKVTKDPKEIIQHKDLDLIVNCAPNQFHYSYSAAALDAGKNVVVEKPFANSVDEGKKLISLAESAGKTLSVFHNRRWDSDFLTAQKLILSGTLGEIKQFESHMDRWRPAFRVERWREQALAGSGLFYDLGSHLIDQALSLFGEPEYVAADIAVQKQGGSADDYLR